MPLFNPQFFSAKKNLALPFGILVALVLTAGVYFPGLTGDFVFDSRSNISSNEALHLTEFDWEQLRTAALSNHSGPTGRPISVATFALNHIAFGLNPFGYKLTNLVIHCINGILIYLLTLNLLRANPQNRANLAVAKRYQWIALGIATLWLLHPINLTNVLYVVQRMNSLSTMFVLAGMLTYTSGRIRALRGKPYLFLSVAIPLLFTVLAVLSKENGALLPLYLLAIEILFFRFHAKSRAVKRSLSIFFATTVAAPAIIAIVFLYNSTDWLDAAYSVRDFSLIERLLTETRVLWIYLSLILIPNGTSYGLFHDDIAISHSLIDPLSTLPATIGLASTVTIAFLTHKKAPILSFGIFLFIASHLIESTIYPLEIAYEHRNYISSYAIIFPCFYYLTTALSRMTHAVLARSIPIACIAIFAAITLMRSTYWSDSVQLAIAEQAHHPDSPRANIMLGITYARLAESHKEKQDEYYLLAKRYFEKETSLTPNATNGLFQLILFSSILDKPTNPAWESELAYRLSNETFLVNNVNLIGAMVTCQIENRCSLNDQTVVHITQSALKNPAAKNHIAAEIYTAASKYALIQQNDPETALFLIANASEAWPETPRYRIHLARLLFALGRLNDAAKELELAEHHDTNGKERAKIAGLRTAIDSAELTPTR